MELNICPNCLEQTTGNNFCPYCGFNIAEYTPKEHHLPPGTIVGERYVIGRVIGEGGFGITYKASDIKLGGKFAVKEYYPSSISGRSASHSDSYMIYPFTGSDEEFRSGLVRFENEARRLAQFDGKAGVVNVKDYISENGTGYIVMEYVEGISLEKYLESKGGFISIRQASELIKPIVTALSEVHKSGLIHRDISPDNMIITENNGMVLIDFGSARQYDSEKSMSVILKFGYAPYEQYSRHGNQGPWTDVYALCAVIYRMITGKKPPDALERLQNNKELDFYGCEISEGMERTLRKGLEIRAANRFQSMDEFYEAFFKGVYPKEKKKPDKKIIIAAAAAAAAVICITVGISLALGDKNNSISVEAESAAVTETAASETTQTALSEITEVSETEQTTSQSEPYTRVRIPYVVGKQISEATKILENKDIKYIVKEVESTDIPTGYVVSLSKKEGSLCDSNDIIIVYKNALEVIDIPDISFMGEQEAINTLTSLGLKYEIRYYNDMRLNHKTVTGYDEYNKYVEKGGTVHLTVATHDDLFDPSAVDKININSYRPKLQKGYPDVCKIEKVKSRFKKDLDNYKADITNGKYNYWSEPNERSSDNTLLDIAEVLGCADAEPEFCYIADDFNNDGRDEYYLFAMLPSEIPIEFTYNDSSGAQVDMGPRDAYVVLMNMYYVSSSGMVTLMNNSETYFERHGTESIDPYKDLENCFTIIDYGEYKHLHCLFECYEIKLSFLVNERSFFRINGIRFDEASKRFVGIDDTEEKYVYLQWDGNEYIVLIFYNGHSYGNSDIYYGGRLSWRSYIEWKKS